MSSSLDASSSDHGRTMLVVLNDEEQYSIWDDERELPAGWYAEGFRGSREECLGHIDDVWTDITPKSVRERLSRPGT